MNYRQIHDIEQETGNKTIPKKKKCRRAKWLCEEALQIAEKRREAKSKGEKERYTHLNAILCNIFTASDFIPITSTTGCCFSLMRPYKQLRKEERRKAKEKRKDLPI